MKATAFRSLLRQDMSIVFRNGYVHVVLGLALVFVLCVWFVFPTEVSVDTKQYWVDQTPDGLITSFAKASALDPHLLTSEEDLRYALEQDPRATGVVYSGTRDNPSATLIHQGTESDRMLRSLEAAAARVWDHAGNLGRPSVATLELLRPAAEKPAFNLSLVPFLLTFESALIGLFFVAALVFQEKEERSIRAFRISPAGTWAYVLSKTGVNVILSVLSALFIFVLTLGIRSELPAVLLLVALASLLMTTFGLAVAVFFKSLSEFVYVLAAIMAVASLPIISYFVPSFGAAFFAYIPTYPLMFGIRELVFSTGKSGFYSQMLLTLSAQALVMLLFAVSAVQRRLMKEGY